MNFLAAVQTILCVFKFLPINLINIFKTNFSLTKYVYLLFSADNISILFNYQSRLKSPLAGTKS